MASSEDPQKEALLKLFNDWKALIKARCSAKPRSLERERLDAVYHQVIPIIIRIAEEGATTADVRLASTLLSGTMIEKRD